MLTTDEPETPLEQLPENVLVKIFQMLSAVDVASFSRTSKYLLSTFEKNKSYVCNNAVVGRFSYANSCLKGKANWYNWIEPDMIFFDEVHKLVPHKIASKYDGLFPPKMCQKYFIFLERSAPKNDDPPELVLNFIWKLVWMYYKDTFNNDPNLEGLKGLDINGCRMGRICGIGPVRLEHHPATQERLMKQLFKKLGLSLGEEL